MWRILKFILDEFVQRIGNNHCYSSNAYESCHLLVYAMVLFKIFEPNKMSTNKYILRRVQEYFDLIVMTVTNLNHRNRDWAAHILLSSLALQAFI